MTSADPTVVLPDEVAVVNVGLPLFADAVRDQGVGGPAGRLADPGGRRPGRWSRHWSGCTAPRSRAIDAANAEVVRRLDEGVPLLVDVAPAAGRSCRACPTGRSCTAGQRSSWAEASATRCAGRMRAAAVAEGWAEHADGADRAAEATATCGWSRPTTTTPWCRWPRAIGPLGAGASSVDNAPAAPGRSPPSTRARATRPGSAGRRRPRSTGWVPARRRRPDAAAGPRAGPAPSTSSPSPPRACRWVTTCTCAPRATTNLLVRNLLPAARRPRRTEGGSSWHGSCPATTSSS